MSFLADVSSERAVLSGLMQFGYDSFIDIDGIVSTNTFTNESNQVIFKCLAHHFLNAQTVPDLPSILAAAKELNVFDLIDNIDDKKHIQSLQNFPIKQENVRKLAIKIKKLEVARLLHNTLGDCQDTIAKVRGNETFGEIMALAENPIFEFSNTVIDNKHAGPIQLGQDIREYINNLKNNPVDNTGISTGFGLYDRAIGGGLRRGTVSVLGARAKIGKSTFGINVALHVAGRLNIPVLLLDTEMSTKDHYHKSVAYYSGVAVNDIECGKFGKSNFNVKKVNDAVSVIEKIPYYYENVAGMTFEEMLSVARRWITKTVGYNSNGTVKDCLLIYDYLKLMSGEGLSDYNREHQALGFQITNLHNFTIKYDIPCLAFIQLNRDGIDKESTDAIAQSDRILWFCSSLAIYKPKTEEEISEDGIENGNRKLILLACRHGKGLDDGDYINMQFNGSVATIKEVNTRNQLFLSKPKEFETEEVDVIE